MPVAFNAALRTGTTQDAILDAFAVRLRAIPTLNIGLVVVTDQPVPFIMPHGKICLSVSGGDGIFPVGPWSGGGAAIGTELSSVVVGIYMVAMLDRPGRAEVAQNSLLGWKRKVLAYLTKEDPHLTRSQAWEPIVNAKPLLRSQPVPRSSTGTLEVPGHAGWIGLQITFSVDFDWDLTIGR